MTIAERIKAIQRESSSDAPGDPERFRRVALTKTEMMSQPDAIRATLDANSKPLAKIAADLASRRIRRVVMIGCGDSWISGYGVRRAMERALGAICEPYEAFDFDCYGTEMCDDETVVIGLSSSGKTEPVIDGMKKAAARGAYTIGLSNTLGSPLMEEFPGALHIRATRGGWPTQSSTASMALKLALAAAIARAKGDQPEFVKELEAGLVALPEQVDAVAQAYFTPAQDLARKLARADLVLLCGAGGAYAPAAFGAAKLKELAPVHAISFPLEEYHHYRTQKAGDPLFVIAPDAQSHQRALETTIMSRGCEGFCIALVPEDETDITEIADLTWHLPKVSDAFAPILYSIPLHLFGYHAAVERDALGLGAPRLGG
ncbi:SIS domain-containing protein [Roseinatronobacter bogoriensis]|uniref:Glutamine--fructose-6-phosphate aminotransferase [isomerizing] n=1 Tax=Roseinatronobacter bogoriensis subsp. barguzinensis TaxID=441209 RepID=A0A2K8KDM6_9RHOB|nr:MULTISPECIES: SIS domain-containing protein [Rhodobaca]ATX67531.1 SIS domain-containing protein [Rhodobaca barguzinensis]MBB4209683.1 glucosamine 6-phosphate synthetase-like amidotransferase/phosphosugar isomerase protein [Rhodobaca bogoriensis DSM 18756]TDW33858.1 SIS domain-containing protein [Rhodobaca barguzinensis]TDY66292.1 SIS domain-containing protein [Rhodobaca bogoriensis DSM 18756]